MTDNKKNQFLPFHAINEFMRDDYRLTVLQEVFTDLDKLEKDKSMQINRLFSKGVQIPGFRNSSLAPLGVKIRHSSSLFEKSPEFAALILESWSRFHQPLKETVWQILEQRNWNPLPITVDRSILPGFMVNWQKGDTFESFIQSVHESQIELKESDDNISLMVVWIGNKLPYGLYDDTTT